MPIQKLSDIEFECRVCGCKNFSPRSLSVVVGDNGKRIFCLSDGSRVNVERFSCTKCSVVFLDPIAFSVQSNVNLKDEALLQVVKTKYLAELRNI
ncbi:hypothetical protein A2533_01435 [Candidatus Falkowbacteria bacterium RIFOXYD2_FULL_35_9]|uniref:Uncharacterized protein n=1 Tax=Candidatus Falkowbacteria bacterium RIFOXYC2_FULL_36_12 TaxID=1798002 RepID=A0A1F5T075_9BACT|nr:MAG: hypothetical protein A2300_03435 [Candidatus Falkowbacteria bacterium RIFOXYB2_FULL_35_7]OGF32348.1 MAG: hypothetical protein A2478_03430 [Candidatus Falkowbacteria bacterium RIFOXYC2_FULL_36_12]OGF33243.1 MAG: hypothetical protein A2223_03910 [Candidatus Falkowbacteria bacterium RIFOXYA2_FULL_35_8]OGF47265.1 MAG: hypothetical protein A2533_01435 [Candidatus Falkowbacteria bacterium RIFOXYD2_FULL_35_9]